MLFKGVGFPPYIYDSIGLLPGFCNNNDFFDKPLGESFEKEISSSSSSLSESDNLEIGAVDGFFGYAFNAFERGGSGSTNSTSMSLSSSLLSMDLYTVWGFVFWEVDLVVAIRRDAEA